MCVNICTETVIKIFIEWKNKCNVVDNVPRPLELQVPPGTHARNRNARRERGKRRDFVTAGFNVVKKKN